jgi:NitT/TauT family transport system ATP-binding protein
MQNDSSSSNLIAFDRVGMRYDGGEVALAGVSFDVQRGEFVCIIGPSGCGKSTVLKLIAGLEEPTAGTVHRPRGVSMVFQSGALFPWLTAVDNAAMGLTARGMPTDAARREAMRSLNLVGMTEFAAKYPRALSGGQRQRVGIARALAVQPDVLLLDEPFSALDAKTTHDLHQDLLHIWRQTGTTIVMVSHLIEEAVSLADRVLLMQRGSIEREYPIVLPRPRRSEAGSFEHVVMTIRTAFFA